MSNSIDVLVIGAGPGGYVCAIRAAQLGMSTVCVDAWSRPNGQPAPGGTCTNVGCIPSKALLQSSEHFDHASHHFADHGIGVKGLSMDVAKMLARKDQVVAQNNDGILYLFKKNKVRFVHGTAHFVSRTDAGTQVQVGDEVFTARQVVIATGSHARALPGVEFDEDVVLSNDGALRIPSVPRRLGLIGSGVIGLEMGSVWRRLGSEVTVLEALPTFLGAVDEQIAKEAHKAFVKQGLQIELGVRVGEIKRSGKGVKVSYTDAKGQVHDTDFDRLIVSIGRVPHTEGLKLEAVGVTLDDRGAVVVDDECRTSVPGIWAVGDVVRGPMLAHKAEEEGVAVAERIAGQHPHVNFNTVPWVIYTSPEIAWVGQTEQQLKAEGREFKSGQFPFAANGRALGTGASAGFVRVLADSRTDAVLGVHIVAANASDLIAEAVLAMEFKASAEDIGRICHPHPSLSEVVREAALAATDNRALNG